MGRAWGLQNHPQTTFPEHEEAWVPEVVVGGEILSWHASSRDLKISDPSLHSAPYNVLS
jgi:hypothetical protein